MRGMKASAETSLNEQRPTRRRPRVRITKTRLRLRAITKLRKGPICAGQDRGCPDGSADEDWLCVERELRERPANRVSAEMLRRA